MEEDVLLWRPLKKEQPKEEEEDSPQLQSAQSKKTAS